MNMGQSTNVPSASSTSVNAYNWASRPESIRSNISFQSMHRNDSPVQLNKLIYGMNNNVMKSRKTLDSLDRPLIIHVEHRKLIDPAKHALGKSPHMTNIFLDHQRDIDRAKPDEDLKSQCEGIMKEFLHAPSGSEDKDVLRSAQKLTLDVVDSHFDRLDSKSQTALFETFLTNHLDHLIFDQKTESCAILRGVRSMGHMLASIEDGNDRVGAAAQMMRKAASLSTEAHKGKGNRIKGTFMRVIGGLGAMMTAPTLAGPILFGLLAGVGERKSGKESKAQNKGFTVVERELLHARKQWKNLSDETKTEFIDAYNTLYENLGQSDGTLRRKKVRTLLPNKESYKHPENFAAYRAKKDSGIIGKMSVKLSSLSERAEARMSFLLPH